MNKRKKKIIATVCSAVAVTGLAIGISLMQAPHSYAIDPPTEECGVGRSVSYWDTLFTDSRGATAYGWEIEECIRECMLEAGGESEADIREHCAIYCKQLLYTQTIGGFDDWGTSLYGIVHSHAYAATRDYIWTEAAAPTDKVREIFWDVWNNGYDSDFRVQCFRSGYYHDLTWSIPAYQIGNSYYSINIYQDFSMFGWSK